MRFHKFGFTLIELLVVISIIGLLASVVLVSLNGARVKARNVKRRSDLKQLQTALEMYNEDKGSYPITGSGAEGVWAEGKCAPAPNGWVLKPDYSGPNAYIPNLAPEYVSGLPGDPKVDASSGRCYGYSSMDGKDYFLWAHAGAEGSYDDNDPMIRLIGPGVDPTANCTQTQGTFVVGSKGRCAPPMP